MKKNILLPLVLLFFITGFSQSQVSEVNFKKLPIDVAKEIQNARYCGEIIFKSYDSIKINSVWVVEKFNWQRLEWKTGTATAKVHGMDSAGSYRTRPDSITSKSSSHGFWPKIGDTCLLVIEKNPCLSLFALIKNGKYIFWNPYVNPSWNSYFVFDKPFEYYPEAPSTKISEVDKTIALKYKKEFAGKYFCEIDKKEFWDLFKKTNWQFANNH